MKTEETTRDGEPFIPQATVFRVFNLMIGLTIKRFSIEQIAEKLDVSTRSAYRYIALLSSLDVCIDKDFNNRYFIAQDDCPICHRINQAEHEEHCYSLPLKVKSKPPRGQGRQSLKSVFQKLNLHLVWHGQKQ